jgi:hypothetical protein
LPVKVIVDGESPEQKSLLPEALIVPGVKAVTVIVVDSEFTQLSSSVTVREYTVVDTGVTVIFAVLSPVLQE